MIRGSKRKKIIIGIHGLGNKPPADTLSAWWKLSIEEGLAQQGSSQRDFQFDLVFWADILYPQLLDPNQTDATNPQFLLEPYTPGEGPPENLSRSFKARVYSYIDRQLDSIFLREDQSLNLKGVTDRIIAKYFSDLEKYISDDFYSLANPDQISREDIKRRLYDVLVKHRDHDIFLVSHSMGSIIAYDVLIECTKELHLHTFVTIGSPLGIPYIMVRELDKQRQLYPELKRPLVPNCISEKWVNLSDPEDRVALDHALGDDFAPNSHGVAISDNTIYNDYRMRGQRNPHKSFGYLRTPEFSELVADFLGSPDERSWDEGWLDKARPMARKTRKIIKKILSR